MATLTELIVDHTCVNRANWRCEVVGCVDADAVGDALLHDGWSSVCRYPSLRIFRRPADGHEIAWVLTSGRMQIRVPLAAADDRPAAAQKIWRELSICFADAPAVSAEATS